MNPLDIAVIAVVVLSAVFAFARGLVREALSIVAWVGAAAVTWYFGDQVRTWVHGFVSDELLTKLIALGGTFIVSLIVLTIITGIVARLVRQAGLSGIDRTLGFIFGLARGAFVVCLAYLLLDMTLPQQNDRPKWISEAKSGPYLHEGADALKSYLPESLKKQTTDAAGELFGPKPSAAEQAKSARDALVNPARPAAASPDSPPPPSYPAGERHQLDRVIGTQR